MTKQDHHVTPDGHPVADSQPGAGAPAVEITSAMTEAGVLALDRYRESYLDETVVEAVYTAMRLQSSDLQIDWRDRNLLRNVNELAISGDPLAFAFPFHSIMQRSIR